MLTAFSTHICLQLLLIVVYFILFILFYRILLLPSSAAVQFCKGRFTNPIV